jgi:hypothetical protein
MVKYADERVWVAFDVLANFIITVAELLNDHIYDALV